MAVPHRDWRESPINAAILWALLTFACVEGLGLFHALAFAGVLIFWIVVTIVAAIYLWRIKRCPITPSQPLSRIDRLLLVWVGLLALTLLVAALVAPPNTWDVMSYHLPRVMAWIQNRSVAPFPTHVSRQIESPPFAEYVILQSQLLVGSDRLANLGQWASLLGSAIATSVIAKRLGAGTRGQALAAIAAATLPPALVEATGAKNDCLVAFWTLCATLKLLDLTSAPTARNALYAGASIGLAMLTKGTFYFFGWPVVALFSILAVRRHRWRAVGPLVLAGCLALALNAAHFTRTYRVIGDPFGSPITRRTIETRRYAPWIIASNALRNLAAQCATPNAWVNQHLLYDPLIRLHQWAGIDPNHPASTSEIGIPFRIRWGQFHDDNTGGGLHVPLILACLVASVWLRSRYPLASALGVALVVSYLTFCLLISWQPWHGRYLIVLYMLCMPLVGLGLERVPKGVGYAVAIVLLLVATPYVLLNQTRPMVGRQNIFNTPRIEQYFASRQPSLLDQYRQAAKLVAATGVTEVGLVSDYDALPYPFRMVLEETAGHPVRLNYLNGFNRRPPEAFKVRVPAQERTAGEVVVVFPWWNWGAFRPTPKVLVEGTGSKFYVVRDFGDIAVYTRGAEATVGRKVFLETGWARDRAGSGIWTKGNATLVLCRPKAGTVFLRGQIASATIPNRVTIKVNGVEVASIVIADQQPRPIGPIDLPCQAGDNLVELAGSGEAVVLDHLTLANEEAELVFPARVRF